MSLNNYDLSNPFQKPFTPYNPFTSPSTQPDLIPQPPTGVIDDGDTINEQMEYLKYYEEKRKREEEDAKLAAMLSVSNQTEEKPLTKSSTPDDYLLAMMIQQEEQENERKKSIEQDEAIARRLYEEDFSSNKKAKLNNTKSDVQTSNLFAQDKTKLGQNRSDDWEETIKLMRSENDLEYSRLLQEKEELEKRLREVETQKVVENNVVINLDSVEYPDYWEHQIEQHSSFDLKKGSNEWNNIQKLFNTTLSGSTIHRIERNQNKKLYMWYFLKKKGIRT